MKRVAFGPIDLRVLTSPRLYARLGPLVVMFWPDRRWWWPEVRWRWGSQ